MKEKRGARRICLLAAALLAAALYPAGARAQTHTFLNLTHLAPSGGAGTSGPVNAYPSSIGVSGLSGTVTKAAVTLIDYHSSSPDDADVAITGPNGQTVMLMSDACGETVVPDGPTFSAVDENWTFDDAASTFLSDGGPCSPNQTASFKPTNYEVSDNEMTPAGGPAGPYLNRLSFLAGGSPNGIWKLFMLDDNGTCCLGAGLSGWALRLEVQPPPPATPATPAAPAAAAAPAATGQRAAALAKCKGKKSKKARKKCRKKAQALPL